MNAEVLGYLKKLLQETPAGPWQVIHNEEGFTQIIDAEGVVIFEAASTSVGFSNETINFLTTGYEILASCFVEMQHLLWTTEMLLKALEEKENSPSSKLLLPT